MSRGLYPRLETAIAEGPGPDRLAAMLGKTRAEIDDVRMGQINPDADLAARMAAALDVEVEELFEPDPTVARLVAGANPSAATIRRVGTILRRPWAAA